MWHEARKQEKLIRGMIVDYRRRAERRRDFYEKIKADPTQFLQIHGRPSKIYLDQAVAVAGESPAIMMPWQGDSTNMIDRFDVRAHLDVIPNLTPTSPVPVEDLDTEERQCNYERYRILAQNMFLGIDEDKFLQQLAIEEQFGVTMDEREGAKEKKDKKSGGAAIGYNYEDPSTSSQTVGTSEATQEIDNELTKKEDDSEDSDDSDLEILDVDLTIDVNKVEANEAHELNLVGELYGMSGSDLFSFLVADAQDSETARLQRAEEKEKALFSGRKSRRERRIHRDKRLAGRIPSPPHYAARETLPENRASNSREVASRSLSPVQPETIQYITSFGGDDDEGPSKTKTYAEKLKENLDKVKPKSYSDVLKSHHTNSGRQVKRVRSRSLSSRSRSRSISRTRSKRSRSRFTTYSLRRSRSERFVPRSGTRKRGSLSPLKKSRVLLKRSYSPLQRSCSPVKRSCSPLKRYRSRSHSQQRYSPYSRSFSSSSRSRRSRSWSSSGSRNKSHLAEVPIPRYYGRRKDDKSSSDLSLDSDTSDDGSVKRAGPEELGKKIGRTSGNSYKESGGYRSETLTLKERLKKKMQVQLARQLKADKKAEEEKREREAEERTRREEALRLAAARQRTRYGRSSDGSRSSRSRSRSVSLDRKHKKSRLRASPSTVSGRKSKSPAIPIWGSQDGRDENSDIKRNDSRKYNDPRKRYCEDSKKEHRSVYARRSSTSIHSNTNESHDHRRYNSERHERDSNDKRRTGECSGNNSSLRKLVDY